MDSYLVCYDISDPKRLRRVARCCEDFGYRKQYSVFLCRVSTTEMVRLRTLLYDLIDLNEDQVLFLPLTDTCLKGMDTIGRGADPYDKNDRVMVV